MSLYPIFSPPAAPTYEYFRLTFTAGSTNIRITEAEFLVGTTAYPTSNMTGNSAPSPLVASSDREDNVPSCFRAFDGSTDGDYFFQSSQVTCFLQLFLGSGNGIAATSLKIIGGNTTSRSPTAFTLKVSNASDFSGEEVTLLTVSGISWSGNETKTWAL